MLLFVFWGKRLNANEIHSEMRPVYGDKCFTRPAYKFGVRSLLAAEKALLIRNDLAGMLLRRPMGIQKLVDRWDKRLNELGRYVEQEAQLMLTTGSTRLAVSRGQQTWYHSTCYI